VTTTETTAPVTAPVTAPETSPEVPLPQQAGTVLTHIAGYMATRITQMGLQSGLLRALEAAPGSTPDDLADALEMDEFFVSVWCRGAFGAGLLERSGTGYQLAPHMATLLLDDTSPAFAGGMFGVISQPEMFGRFADNLHTGERFWWDDTSPDWIAGVAGTGRPFYTRLVPGGLAKVPGLEEVLTAGARVVDTACGAGQGVLRLATAYPSSTVVGVDGDAHSITRAQYAVEQAGLSPRVELVVSPLEEFVLAEPADVVINNISMHECRDIDQVAERVFEALRPGGWFVISDFPFPDTDEGLRSVPGRLMSGIQFFEAQIDDQLLPRSAYDDLLTRHGFTDLGSFEISPVHAVTWGRRPA